MPFNRTRLDEMLDDLEAALPRIVADNPDDDAFWPLFSSHAEVIEASASDDDYAHVRARLSSMLQSVGKVHPEESGRSAGAGHG